MPTTTRATPRIFCARSIGGPSFSAGGSARLIPVRDRIPPIASERSAAHAHARGRLTALVLVALHQIQNASNRRPVEPARRDLIHRQILLDEGLENRVENFIGRQAVGVFLLVAQFRRRRALDDTRGYYARPSIAPRAEPIHQ